MPELLLVFPPQWSPFQPALSLPSLSAWLKRAGYSVSSLDLNVQFYEWLLSDECAGMLVEQVLASDRPAAEQEAYLAVFGGVADFRADVARLRDAGGDATEDFMAGNYAAVQSFQTYLDAVSAVAGTFSVSPYQFQLASGNLRVADLERQVAEPPVLIERFLRGAVERLILPAAPGVVGLSCIGQEQLYFTLLLGRLVKEVCAAPVVVGGTIFARIFERGVLRPEWFETYFDVIVRNEGEKPLEGLLANRAAGRPLTEGVPGVVHRGGSSAPCAPLSVAELPIPDFDDLPLGRYLSPELTLPLLSARGCYWGKCEFCHHGMVYGEKYAPYKAPSLLETVRTLSERYGVRHFAFNDEALPPTSARAIARTFPPHAETGWTFTGLIKFEPSYTRADFDGIHAAGFRSLYVGLESASERVLDLMKKRSTRRTIVANLTDATGAGIWMHCFLFFGFPGETHADARETYDFILEHPDIVSSYGAGTFSLEHNAPIFRHLADHGLRLRPTAAGDVDVYYDYEVEHGISAAEALEWQDRLNEAAGGIEEYSAAKWVPRELLLCLLARMTPEELRRVGLRMRACGGMPAPTPLRSITTVSPDAGIVVNRMNGRVLALRGPAVEVFELCRDALDLGAVRELAPVLFDRLAFYGPAAESRPTAGVAAG